MKIPYAAIPDTIWNGHDVVNFQGNEYPEYFTGSVPAGKTLNADLGGRWLESLKMPNGSMVFSKEFPDDVAFIDVKAGGKLNLNADKIQNQQLTEGLKNPFTEVYQQYPIGGRNVVSVTGNGDVNLDMGFWGNNAFVSANTANVKLGNGEGYYQASGKSSGHQIEGGSSADNFVYDLAGVGAGSIGSNSFNAKLGSTEGDNLDAMQLVNLPAGYVVTVGVTAIRGGGTFKDADLKATIKDSTGRVVGDVGGVNVNYLFLTNENGFQTAVSPTSIGTNGSRSYTIGNQSPSQATAQAREESTTSARSLSAESLNPADLPIPERVSEQAPKKL